jgi:hypothetical protein
MPVEMRRRDETDGNRNPEVGIDRAKSTYSAAYERRRE